MQSQGLHRWWGPFLCTQDRCTARRYNSQEELKEACGRSAWPDQGRLEQVWSGRIRSGLVSFALVRFALVRSLRSGQSTIGEKAQTDHNPNTSGESQPTPPGKTASNSASSDAGFDAITSGGVLHPWFRSLEVRAATSASSATRVSHVRNVSDVSHSLERTRSKGSGLPPASDHGHDWSWPPVLVTS